jgi:hypothetical protein
MYSCFQRYRALAGVTWLYVASRILYSLTSELSWSKAQTYLYAFGEIMLFGIAVNGLTF